MSSSGDENDEGSDEEEEEVGPDGTITKTRRKSESPFHILFAYLNIWIVYVWICNYLNF